MKNKPVFAKKHKKMHFFNNFSTIFQQFSVDN